MTSLKLAKDFTGNDIYCNHLNVDTLTSGTVLNLTGDVTVNRNLSVTGNTTASTITANTGTTCAGTINVRDDTRICSGGAGVNTLAFFNGPGRQQVAGPPAVVPAAGAAADVANNDYVVALSTINNAFVQYGLLA